MFNLIHKKGRRDFFLSPPLLFESVDRLGNQINRPRATAPLCLAPHDLRLAASDQLFKLGVQRDFADWVSEVTKARFDCLEGKRSSFRERDRPFRATATAFHGSSFIHVHTLLPISN